MCSHPRWQEFAIARSNGVPLKEIQKRLQEDGINVTVQSISHHFRNHEKGKVPTTKPINETDFMTDEYLKSRMSDSAFIVDQIVQNLGILRQMTNNLMKATKEADPRFLSTLINACKEIRMTFREVLELRSKLQLEVQADEIDIENLATILNEIPAEWTGPILERLETLTGDKYG